MYCCNCGIPKCPFGSLSSNGFLEYKTSKKCHVEEHIVDLTDLPIFRAGEFEQDPNYYNTDRMYFCINQFNSYGDILILGTKSVGQSYDALCCTGGICEYRESEKICHEKNDTSWVFTHESQKKETAFLRSDLDGQYSDKLWYLDNYGYYASSVINPPIQGDPFFTKNNIHPVLSRKMDEAMPFPHEDPYDTLLRFHRGIIEWGSNIGANTTQAITVSERHCELYDTTDPWYKKIRIFTFATPSGCGNCFDCIGVDKCNHCELPFCANNVDRVCDVSSISSAISEETTPCGKWYEAQNELDRPWSIKLRCTVSCSNNKSIHCFPENNWRYGDQHLCPVGECNQLKDVGTEILGKSYNKFEENYKYGNFSDDGVWLDCAPPDGSYDSRANEDEEEDGRCCIGDGSFIVCLDNNNLPISEPDRPPITKVTPGGCFSGYKTVFNPSIPIKGRWSQHGLCDVNPCYTNCIGEDCDDICTGKNCTGVCAGGTAFKTKKCPACQTTMGSFLSNGVKGSCSPFPFGTLTNGQPYYKGCGCRVEDDGESSDTPGINPLNGSLCYFQKWSEFVEEKHGENVSCGDYCLERDCYSKDGLYYNPTCVPSCPKYWYWPKFDYIEPSCCVDGFPDKCDCLPSTCCGECSRCDISENGCQGFKCCGHEIPGTICPDDCPEETGTFGCGFGPCHCPCPPPCTCDTDCNCNGGEFDCCNAPTICDSSPNGCPCPEPEPCICNCSGNCCCRTSAEGYCGDCENGCGSGKAKSASTETGED